MKRTRKKMGLPEAHINVTSLLDITFVLLIAFMVVAPAVQQSAELKLPKARQSDAIAKPPKLNIEVTMADGAPVYAFNGRSSSLSDIPADIRTSADYTPEAVVALRADKTVPWEDVARLINELKFDGINNLGIVTEKER